MPVVHLSTKRIAVPPFSTLSSWRYDIPIAASRHSSGAQIACRRQNWRVNSQPETFPYKFRHFCESCGAGSSMIWCSACDGEGYYLTEPGKAGHPYKQGMARCKICNGIGVVPCPLCGGQEIKLREPDPEKGPPGKTSEMSIYDWLGQFG